MLSTIDGIYTNLDRYGHMERLSTLHEHNPFLSSKRTILTGKLSMKNFMAQSWVLTISDLVGSNGERMGVPEVCLRVDAPRIRVG